MKGLKKFQDGGETVSIKGKDGKVREVKRGSKEYTELYPKLVDKNPDGSYTSLVDLPEVRVSAGYGEDKANLIRTLKLYGQDTPYKVSSLIGGMDNLDVKFLPNSKLKVPYIDSKGINSRVTPQYKTLYKTILLPESDKKGFLNSNDPAIALHHFSLMDDFAAELAHQVQIKNVGPNDVKSFIKTSPSYLRRRQYNKEGSPEHKAHNIYEPAIKDYLLSSTENSPVGPEDFKAGVQYYKNIQSGYFKGVKKGIVNKRSPSTADRSFNDVIIPSRRDVTSKEFYRDIYKKNKEYIENQAIDNIGAVEDKDPEEFKTGGIIDPRGQWAHPGKVTTIPGNNITMKGVNYPVLGISNTGDKKLMMPGRDYKFKGKSVTEYPIKMQSGGTVPGAVMLPYETPEQQKARMQKYGLPMPTAADSLAVYNNAMRVNAFYTDPVRNYKPAIVEDEHGVKYTPARQIDETLKEYSDLTNFKRLAEDRVSQADKVLKVDRAIHNLDPDYFERVYGFKPNFDQALKSNRIFSDYQYSVQDRIPGLINPSAPAQYSDFRIRPTFTTNLGAEPNLEIGTTDPGALTTLHGYNPLDVKPWHMRTEEEKQYLRNRKAGITTSFKKPAMTKFGQKDPLPTKGIPKLNVFGSNPDIKTPALKPMQNKLPAASKPAFSIPSTHLLNGAEMKDIYEWDETTQQYRMVDTVTPEAARSIYKAYAKSSLDSMKADLNTMGLNKGKGTRNPFIQ